MYGKINKKMLPFCIKDIFERYTDENHRLSQKDIEQLLLDKYDMKADRKSIKRNIMDLIDTGMDIQYSENYRMVRDKNTGEIEEQCVQTDFYLLREFSDCEIHLLIDELVDSEYIPSKQCKQLVRKLEGLSSIYYRKNIGAERCLLEGPSRHNQLFYSLEIIDSALAQNKKVCFIYEGDKHTVIPRETQVENGQYFLIADLPEKKREYFRLDCISEIKIAS